MLLDTIESNEASHVHHTVAKFLGSRLFQIGSAVGYGFLDGIVGSIPPLHYDVLHPSMWIGPIGWILLSAVPMIMVNVVLNHLYCSYSGRGLRSAGRISLRVVKKRGVIDRAGEGALWFLIAEYVSYAYQAGSLVGFYDYWQSALGVPYIGKLIYPGIPLAYYILLGIFTSYEIGRFIVHGRSVKIRKI
jgi:hypothetical protein